MRHLHAGFGSEAPVEYLQVGGPEENDAVVENFLASHPGFVLGDAASELARAGIALDTGKFLRLYPHRHACDGFFAALLQRSA